MPTTTQKQDISTAYSHGEWETRVNLAALYRIVAKYGMSDLANGAIGARVAGEPNCYLTHPYGLFWDEIKATDLVKIDRNGQPVAPDAPWLNDGAVNLCKWIFGHRQDLNYFVHGHDEEVMAVGSIEDGLLPLNQPAVYLGHILDYIEYTFEEDDEYAAHFVEKLADKQILITRNHGYYVMGDTPAAAFFCAYFLRQTCSAQIKTMSMGRDLHMIDPQRVARYQDEMAVSPDYNYNGQTEWPALLRMLERTQPEYRT
ncbi:class II aldolase/adducin family protein [Mesorhizobium sp. DCY119]|uniref:class II aldolase/adducin family protein n=1 Tax=Mesorhizobium sp. DCY119 TaxID=2108445 RepID=UPI0014030B66|nr:class II aldolase/adducin family protein [Mesorhizobium sp. DCY119]